MRGKKSGNLSRWQIIFNGQSTRVSFDKIVEILRDDYRTDFFVADIYYILYVERNNKNYFTTITLLIK